MDWAGDNSLHSAARSPTPNPSTGPEPRNAVRRAVRIGAIQTLDTAVPS